MPNNLDMGGFGSPGLPVRSEIRGSVVVDVANAAGANIMDLRRSGQARYGFGPEGILTISPTGGLKSNGIVSLDSINAYVAINSNGMMKQYFDGTQVRLASTVALYWASDINANTVEFSQSRYAANTLIQRSGTNAQQSILSRSWSDTSNYSWYRAAWNASTLLLMAEGAGTGTDGSVAFNDAALATNATVGFLMIPSCAGTPSGTPANIPTGQIPLVWDSTNLKLYAYTGGAWKASAAFT